MAWFAFSYPKGAALRKGRRGIIDLLCLASYNPPMA
jgi:hypothetical protein